MKLNNTKQRNNPTHSVCVEAFSEYGSNCFRQRSYLRILAGTYIFNSVLRVCKSYINEAQ